MKVNKLDLTSCKGLAFEIFSQGIHSRSKDVNGVELFCRPIGLDTEEFYNSILIKDKIQIGNMLFNWVVENISQLKSKYKEIEFVTINLEASSILSLKNELIDIKFNLEKYSILLMIEITERKRFFSKELLKCIYELNDLGVKFAIDDMTIYEVGIPVINLSIFDILKFKISDYFRIQNRDEFIKMVLNNGKKIIVENIEKTEDAKRLINEPISFFQGYLFCKPKKIGEMVLN